MSVVKLSGSEFRAWLDSDWGDGWWDDYRLLINGSENADYDSAGIANEDRIEIHGGVVFLDTAAEKSLSVAAHIKRWRAAQAHSFLTIKVPKENVEDLKAYLQTIDATF